MLRWERAIRVIRAIRGWSAWRSAPIFLHEILWPASSCHPFSVIDAYWSEPNWRVKDIAELVVENLA